MSKGKSGKSAGRQEAGSLRFSTVNAVLAAAGLACVVLGYYLLAQGSVTAAPILLVVGYVVLMPLAIIL